MSERIKLRGRRAEIKEELAELEVRADNHIRTIRDLVDPYELFTQLKTKQAYQAMKSLDIIVESAKKLESQLEQINKELGD